ncbi:MAG: MotA/TolQ/ExbB proton channel family protein [Proteobacteria bacterium]|nr:MotA/TolQ/ExbB proton channel family protein [Pseudomonadota bacterium]
MINKCKSKSNSLNLENEQVKVGDETIPANSLFGNYLASLKNISERTDDTINNSNTVDILIARTKGSHDIGWFLVDVLLKLGLMGTIVGFVLMLGSVANAESLNVDTMQNILQQMSLGMGTALFTTLTGLTCSLLLGLQYLVLDKGADKLIEHILEFSDTGLE